MEGWCTVLWAMRLEHGLILRINGENQRNEKEDVATVLLDYF